MYNGIEKKYSVVRISFFDYNKYDALTLLIHLGYLAYKEDTRRVSIPNEEIRLEFAKSVREVEHTETIY